MQTSKSNSNLALTITQTKKKQQYLVSPVIPMRPFSGIEKTGRNYKRDGMIIENPLILSRHSNKESLNTSLSSLEITSTTQQSGSFFE